jgi:type II secretory pathway pseudopilin PulG
MLIVVLAAIVSSISAFFLMKQTQASQPSQASLAELQAAVASLQTQGATASTSPPMTEAPLCPENYAPVKDINGKMYKNACYAQSVGAQFAPTPMTQSEIDEILGGMPQASGSKTTMSPGSVDATASIPNIHEVMDQAFGKPTEKPANKPPAKTSTPSMGSAGPGNTVIIPKPEYAGFK